MAPAPLATARHPLAVLRTARRWSGQRYLIEVNRHHKVLGYGAMATHRKKIWQWESGCVVPELTAQLAIAALEDVPSEAVHRLGWPDWLLLALDGDSLLRVPWTVEGTRHALIETSAGGPMDRRGFLIVTGTTLVDAATVWAGLTSTSTVGKAYPHIGADAIPGLQARLSQLSRLDDVLGSGKLRDLAAAELRLLTGTTHTADTEQRLYSLAAQASRLCGWLCYDSGLHAAAQRYYLTALRASATAGDALTGTNPLAFQAIQTYTVGNPRDAVDLMQTARASIQRRSTPKTLSILHAREARALSKLNDHQRCVRALNAAFDALTTTCDHEPEWCYWINDTEIHMLAGSCALDLGDPRRALYHFTTAQAAFDTDSFPGGAAIYLARAAEAHLALGDLDAAASLGTQALCCHTTVDSARGDQTLTGLRAKLARQGRTPIVREFLEYAAPPPTDSY
jgi:tetratricopeptide (TPR) repeat protein